MPRTRPRRNPLPVVKELDVNHRPDRTILQAVFQDWFAVHKGKLRDLGLIEHGQVRWDKLLDTHTAFVDVEHVLEWMQKWVRYDGFTQTGAQKQMIKDFLKYGTLADAHMLNEELVNDIWEWEDRTGEDLRGNHIVESQLPDILMDWWYSDNLGTLTRFREKYWTRPLESGKEIRILIAKTIWDVCFSDIGDEDFTSRFKDKTYFFDCIRGLLEKTRTGKRIWKEVRDEIDEVHRRMERERRRQEQQERDEHELRRQARRERDERDERRRQERRDRDRHEEQRRGR